MTSFKGYANDIENERVNVESMCLFKTNVFHALNILKSIVTNKHIDSKLTLSFSRYYHIP